MVKQIGTFEVGQKKKPLKKMLAKDLNGDEVVINFWQQFMDLVNVNKVFILKNLKVTDFPSDGHKHVETFFDKSIVIAGSEEDEIEFKDVSLADGFVTGQVQLVHSVASYDACPHCSGKLDSRLPHCPKCKKAVQGSENWFRYEICLETEGKDEINAFNVTGFKPSIEKFLTKNLPLSNEDVENDLNDVLEGKRVKIEWNYKYKTSEQLVFAINLIDES